MVILKEILPKEAWAWWDSVSHIYDEVYPTNQQVEHLFGSVIVLRECTEREKFMPLTGTYEKYLAFN